jgi:hypothetical protein
MNKEVKLTRRGLEMFEFLGEVSAPTGKDFYRIAQGFARGMSEEAKREYEHVVRRCLTAGIGYREVFREQGIC